MHLKPRIGHIRLDRLNLGRLVEMFDVIVDENETIAAEDAERREQVARCRPTKRGRAPQGPSASGWPPSGPSRGDEAAPEAHGRGNAPAHPLHPPAALNAAIARELITFNPASHVELESGKRPKALL
ncbi:hypothetical protein [Streptomyces sp. NBC_01187]|uniref:hypothetical protein n=1 Tax=Streptomyces sp. NBC_01187 TaxID=2903766 RepID=UPI003863AD39|nr:hypothetical protein OG220_21000 [Streptomyces sp. NBC_01187]